MKDKSRDLEYTLRALYTKWIFTYKTPAFEPEAEVVPLHIEETHVVTLWAI
jgi:hypothetical protein